jgi:hypothetical protein
MLDADHHRNLLELVDQATPEGQAVAKLLSDHAPTGRPILVDGKWVADPRGRIICQKCDGIMGRADWPCPLVRDLAQMLNARTTLTLPECVAAGGHHWFDGGGGVSPSHALHWQLCITCPAMREGRKLLYRNDADIEWDEPRDRRVST